MEWLKEGIGNLHCLWFSQSWKLFAKDWVLKVIFYLQGDQKGFIYRARNFWITHRPNFLPGKPLVLITESEWLLPSWIVTLLIFQPFIKPISCHWSFSLPPVRAWIVLLTRPLNMKKIVGKRRAITKWWTRNHQRINVETWKVDTMWHILTEIT